MIGNAEILDSLLKNHFKRLTTLSLHMGYHRSSALEGKLGHIRTHFSQTVIEEALRAKLPRVSRKVRLNISVDHSV